MNRAETKWLDDLKAYEDAGGRIPEDIRAALFYAFCMQDWTVIVYGQPFNIQLDLFCDVADWIELNGPDMSRTSLPKPIFGL